jgi:hypothetical protein
MADIDDEESDLTEEEARSVLPQVVLDAWAEEAKFIAKRVEFANRSSVIQKALTFLPWVGDVFDADNEIDVAAACSDVNRQDRARIIAEKIEKGLGLTLDEDSRKHILEDVYALYDKNKDEL